MVAIRSLLAGALLLAQQLVFAGSPVVPSQLRLVPVVGGFNAPVAVRSAPDDARLFVVEQGGSIRIVQSGTLLPTPFLRVAGTGGTAPPLGFSNGGERGLLGLAFHPDYTSNGRFYVYYTDARGDTVVSRYLRSANDQNLADPNSGSVVLRADQDFDNHNGGDIHFGPDGFLYIGLGDGGRGNDPCNRAQTLLIADILSGMQNGEDCNADSNFASAQSGGVGGDPTSLALMGKMLRIDVDASGNAAQELCGAGGSGAAPYAIPNDNPHAASDGICNEVWHAGLRNPFRFSFDRDTGDMYIGDVGQSTREEIDVAPAGTGGLNFGWRCREGELAGGNVSLCANPPPFTDPILTYDNNSIGCSVSGGFRYRGPQASLAGAYFYGDFCSGRLFAARPVAAVTGAWQSLEWQDSSRSPSGFGEAADGELYLVDYAGCVLRLDAETVFRDGLEDPRPGC